MDVPTDSEKAAFALAVIGTYGLWQMDDDPDPRALIAPGIGFAGVLYVWSKENDSRGD